MSIQSEINRITGFRNSSLSAVSDKGVVVPSGSAIDDLPELIQRIPAYSAVAVYAPANGTITISSIAVKLGDLSWTYNSNYSRFQSTTLQDIIDKPSAQATALAGLFCQNYKTVAASSVTATDKSIGVATSGVLLIRDSDYTQATAFKNAMGDVTIVLPLDTPSSGAIGSTFSISVSVDSPHNEDIAFADKQKVAADGTSEDRIVVLTATEVNIDSSFDYWEIDGIWLPVDGDVYSTQLVIEVESDLTVTAHFY